MSSDIILKLKLANIAYKASIAFDSCPYDDEIEDTIQEFKHNDCFDNVKKAFQMYGGSSNNDMESKIIRLIDSLEYSL